MSSTEFDKNVPVKFGDFIRAARKKRGLTMEAAAKLLHCTRAWVHVLETKPGTNPTIDTLANMAIIYSVAFEEVARLAAEGAPDAAYRETLAMGRKGKRK
jgi:transcriptional regulator with XRE-family HTH domain